MHASAAALPDRALPHLFVFIIFVWYLLLEVTIVWNTFPTPGTLWVYRPVRSLPYLTF